MSIKKLFIESLDEFVEDNSITLYHYSSQNKEKLKISPDKVGKNTWSKSEMKASSYPRSFFYLHLKDKERHFANKSLYKTIVPESAIYDITKDPRGLIQKIKSENNGVLNMDILLKSIHEGGFMGAYYKVSSREVVILFEAVTANLVKTESGKFIRNTNKSRIEEILNTKNVAIISAFRGENSGEKNNKADVQLFNDLMQTNFDFTEAEGGFIENMGEDDETEVVEKSYMVWSEDKEALMEKAKQLAKKYKQEAVLWKQVDDPMGYFLSPSGKLEQVGVYTPNQKDQYFTRIGDFHFVFR